MTVYFLGTITILVPRIDLNNPGTDVYNPGQAVFTKLGPRTHLLQFSYFRMYQDCKMLQKLQFSHFHKYYDCNYASYTILLLLIYNYATFTKSSSVLMSSNEDSCLSGCPHAQNVGDFGSPSLHRILVRFIPIVRILFRFNRTLVGPPRVRLV